MASLTAKPGAGIIAGRLSTLPSVWLKTLLVTGFGADRLNAPAPPASIKKRSAAISSSMWIHGQ